MASSRYKDRFILLSIVALCLIVVGVAGLAVWKLGIRPAQLSFRPQPVSLTAGPSEQLIETDCFAMALPTEFERLPLSGCEVNAFARPRKYQYINVDAYSAVTSLSEAESHWRERWLTLGAEQTSRQEVRWSGLPAVRLVESYPQNKQAFVTYLVFLPRPLPLRDGSQVRAFELRGWGTELTDQAVLDTLIMRWQWRF